MAAARATFAALQRRSTVNRMMRVMTMTSAATAAAAAAAARVGRRMYSSSSGIAVSHNSQALKALFDNPSLANSNSPAIARTRTPAGLFDVPVLTRPGGLVEYGKVGLRVCWVCVLSLLCVFLYVCLSVCLSG